MTPLQKSLIESYLIDAKRLFVSGEYRYKIYNLFRNEIYEMNLTPNDYESSIRRLAKVVGI